MDRALDTDHQTKSSVHGPWYAVLGLLLIVTLIASMTAQPALPAAATADEEAQFVAALNQVRAGVGLPALTVNAELVGLARQHAQVMADAGRIFHSDPISAGYTGPWAKLGENVGVGANVQVLVDAFVASPGHYANIVDPSFTQIGVGVVWRDNALYTTHRFLQLPAAPPPTTQPPATQPPTTTPPATAPPLPEPTPTPGPTSPPPVTTPTTTTLAPLPPPAVLPERIIELINLAELVGT